MAAAEIIGILDQERTIIQLKEPLEKVRAGKVHLFVVQEEDISENELAEYASASFKDLDHAAEDIYSLDDGKPFYDKG